MRTSACKCPCTVCGRRVGKNSIRCTKCKNWLHKRCTGFLGSVAKTKKFICQGLLHKNLDERVTLVKNNIKTVDRFSYLWDVLSADKGVQEVVISKIRFA